jgi:hypothetical protein
MTTALEPTVEKPQLPAPLLRPVVKASDLIEAHKEVASLIREALEDGVDYGLIPGTNKPTLLKPGAERLVRAYGCHSQFTLISQEVDHNYEYEYQDKYKKPHKAKGLYRYVYKCQIITSDGRVVGDSDGSCSSMESKYQSRPKDSENTVIKMAQKRAFVGATLNAFGLSGRFTQDMEDHSVQEAEEEKPAWKEEIYQGTEIEKKRLFERLKENQISAEIFEDISKAMVGRPRKDIGEIVKRFMVKQ